jgi:hypothetical protein
MSDDNNDRIIDAKKLINRVSEILKEVSDDEIIEIFSDGCLNTILYSIFQSDPKGDIYEHLLQNKTRSMIIACIYNTIVRNYAFKGFVDEKPVFVSPSFQQWYEDGVMFTQGQNPFNGLIGLYQDGKVKFAVSGVDANEGDKLSHEDLIFLSIEESKERFEKLKPKSLDSLNKSVEKLENLLKDKVNDESVYQDLLEENPWMFGGEYESIDPHKILDDENIPDFSGLRIHDRCRDIIEIKAPFLKLFRKNGKFTSNFNEAWNQTEEYLDFAITDSDYLRRKKHLRFENPKAVLLIGQGLTDKQREKIHAKERGNPRIKVLTYENLLNYAKHTVTYIENLKNMENDVK